LYFGVNVYAYQAKFSSLAHEALFSAVFLVNIEYIYCLVLKIHKRISQSLDPFRNPYYAGRFCAL